jgi:glutamyl-tRNA reductase
LDSIAEAEVKKTLQSSKIPHTTTEAIQKMVNSLINKILHDPTIFLKKNGMLADRSRYIDAVRKLFNLDA